MQAAQISAGGRADEAEGGLWALVPVKRFASGKSRLAGALSAAQRAELMCHMLSDVVDALLQARCVERVVVLSNERGIDAVLNGTGIERVPEPVEGDVNRSLAVFIATLPRTVRRVLILPADVPAVSAEDIDALARAATRGSLVLCPAAADRGTNALLGPVPLVVSPRFGSESLARHVSDAQRHGVAADVIWRPGLARDVDIPEDLVWLARSPHGGRAAAFARRLAA